MRGSNHQSAPMEKAQSWLTGSHRQCAVWLLSDYYERPFRGVQFDDLAGGRPADVITDNDLIAVRSLSIGFPRAFVEDLRGDEAQSRLRRMLANVPPDVGLEDLPRRTSNSIWDRTARRGSCGTTSPYRSDASRPGHLWWVPASCWPPQGQSWCPWRTASSVARSTAAATRSGKPSTRSSRTRKSAQTWPRYASK